MRALAQLGPGLGWRGLLAAASMFGILGASLPASGVMAAEPFSLGVDAVYRVDPGARTVSVILSATFRNTTPDRPGTVSLYRAIPIALQPGASSVTARDSSGPLAVSIRVSSGQTLATVSLRTALRYGRSTTLSVAFRLNDGASPHMRIRPDVVVVPLWAFGTAGSVGVRIPATLAAGVNGERVTSASVAGQTVLSSGRLSNPGAWQALLTAVGDPIYTTVSRSLPLNGGTVDLRVRAWLDDPAWGSRTLALAVQALPALQDVIGLPYTAATPLVITEALPVGTGGLSEPLPGAQEIRVAFDATSFAMLHELAHVWLDGSVAQERWITEGLASQAAAQVAPALRVGLPFDPSREAALRADAAIPLDQWQLGPAPATTQSSPATDAWAYAASWDFMRRVAAAVGSERLWAIIRAGVAGASGYRTAGVDANGGSTDSSERAALDSRRLLDLFDEQVPDTMDAAFAAEVMPRSSASLLASRGTARTSYAALLAAADGWPAPDPVRDAMESWRFDEAESLMSTARQWLVARDRLLTDARRLGLSPPDRLATAWRIDGGGLQAVAELRAEQSLVDAFASAKSSIAGPNPVELLGLLGGPMPSDLLEQASGRFTGGDLSGSAASIERATSLAVGAQASGVVRLGLGAAILAVAAFGVALAVHRLNRWLQRRRAGAGLAQPPSG